MPNFQEITVSKPADMIEKITILQDRFNVIEALEDYNKKYMDNCETSQSVLKARLGTWYIRHQGYIYRVMKEKEQIEEYQNIERLIFFNHTNLKQDQIMYLIKWLNILCDTLTITKVDTRKYYDRTDIEKDNEYNGLD